MWRAASQRRRFSASEALSVIRRRGRARPMSAMLPDVRTKAPYQPRAPAWSSGLEGLLTAKAAVVCAP